METSLSKSITHSLNFIPTLIRIYNNFIDDADDIIDTLDKFDKDDKNYGSNVRSETCDFIDDTDKLLEKFKIDHKLLQDDFSALIKDKHNEDVIFELRKYLELYKKLKKIHEKLVDLSSDGQIIISESIFSDNYVIHVNMKKVISQILRYDEIIKHDMKRMETLLSIENDEDDKKKKH